jgi:hypothetical protein
MSTIMGAEPVRKRLREIPLTFAPLLIKFRQ